jgi:hypothetical protein
MKSLLGRLKKIEQAFSRKIEKGCRHIFHVLGTQTWTDSDGRVFDSLDEAQKGSKTEPFVQHIWNMANPDTKNKILELEKRANEIATPAAENSENLSKGTL